VASSSVPAISAAANTPIMRTTKTHWRGVMVHDPRAEGLERQAARHGSTIRAHGQCSHWAGAAAH
jgi:hypothetical protein